MSRKKVSNTKVKTTKTSDENSSDFSDTVTEQDITTVVRRGMKEVMTSMMDKMRPEFQQMAIEAGHHGAKMAMYGDDIEYLKKVISDKEKEIFVLEQKKDELELKLKEIGGNDEKLRLQIKQKQNDIDFVKHQLKQTKNRLSERKKELNDERLNNEKKMQELQKEIKDWKIKADDYKAKLGVQKAAENIAKRELPGARARIEELEAQLTQLREAQVTQLRGAQVLHPRKAKVTQPKERSN